ncbi:hypothetical protein DO70_2254 [Burkholderia pseudomallei]|nr:hypothetical protein DO70_2254 [Burkholderia pseudomallei]
MLVVAAQSDCGQRAFRQDARYTFAAGIATSQRAKRDAAPLRSSAHARPGIPEIRTTDCGVFRPL